MMMMMMMDDHDEQEDSRTWAWHLASSWFWSQKMDIFIIYFIFLLICLNNDGGKTTPASISAMQRELQLGSQPFWLEWRACISATCGVQALFLLLKGIAWVWALHNSFGHAQSKARPDAASVIDPGVNEKTRQRNHRNWLGPLHKSVRMLSNVAYVIHSQQKEWVHISHGVSWVSRSNIWNLEARGCEYHKADTWYVEGVELNSQ